MQYLISDVANLTKLSSHTLRYYEKEGLITNVKRDNNGLRVYDDNDIELINIITCLKDTGMKISDIKAYLALDVSNNANRLAIFEKQRNQLLAQIEILNKHLATADYKIWYYQNVDNLADKDDPHKCEKMRHLLISVNIFHRCV